MITPPPPPFPSLAVLAERPLRLLVDLRELGQLVVSQPRIHLGQRRGWNRLGRRLRRHDRKLRPLEVFSKEPAGRALIGTLVAILIVTHLVPHVHPGTQNGTRTLLLGALIVRIGVWGPFYYTHNKELFRSFRKEGTLI